MTPTPVATSANGPRSPNMMMRWATVFVCLFLMAWAATDENNWGIRFPRDGQGQDYYNLLVDGLLEGHLHLKVAQTASGELPFLMDASLYQGKYYLYFGIVPALLTFLPHAYLTGSDMPENLATLLLVGGGFLATLRLYVLARRRYFPACPAWVEACLLFLLAFGTGTPVLLFIGGFYEVALAGGYMCFAVTLLALYQTIHVRRHASPWLALASLAGGLAVGCRPTYLLALPILLVPPLLWFRDPAGTLEGRRWLTGLGAAVIPAGLIGLLLMAYNYGRFGDPFEFGFRYQVSALISTGLPFARVDFIWPNLDWYYLTPPVLSPYFPYVFPINASNRPVDYYGYELIHGQWPVLPLLLTGLIGIAMARVRRVAFPRGLLVIGGLAVLAFALTLACLLTFGFRANRYVADFQPPLILALALAGAFTATTAGPAGGWTGRVYRGAFGMGALVVALFNFLVGLQWMDHMANSRPVVFRPLAYYGNHPSHWLHLAGFMPYGPLRFPVTFQTPAKSVREPLVAAGTNGYTDVLYAAQHPDGRIQLMLDHSGAGGLKMALEPIPPGVPQLIEVDLGSFYPPRLHPYFDGWDEMQIDRRKTWAHITLNGRTVIEGVQRFNDALPGTIEFGRNPRNRDLAFSGALGPVERLEPRFVEAPEEFGLWRLECEFPAAPLNIGQPLLGSGVGGQGNLLLVESVSAGEIRFGFDQWGMGITHSPPLRVDFARPHRLEVLVGPLLTRQPVLTDWRMATGDLAPLASALQVWLDGQLAWQTEIRAHHWSYNRVSVGTNPQGFSTANIAFSGPFRRLPLSVYERKALLDRALRAAIAVR